MIDSIYKPNDIGLNIVTGVEQNYIASTDPITTPHGFNVLHIIAEYAPEAIYDTHRVITDSGEFKPSNFLKAMDNIRSRSVDIVNVSAGRHHSDCGGRCRICHATNKVVGDGTIVVAGAGNQMPGDEEKSLYCPALSNKAIAVGSYEARCGLTLKQRTNGDLYRTVPHALFPPGAYWVRNTEAASRGEAVYTPFCSRRGCSKHHSCEEYRQEQLSAINVSFKHGEPDVFAPDQYVIERMDGTPGIDRGTSFAAALISGALADILSTIVEDRVLPTPSELREAIRSISTTVEGTSQRRFDSTELYRILSPRYEII